jgi:drug/metabolite transporter (DMT)-like permease
VPVSADIVSYFLLGDKIEFSEIIGIITIIIGIILINKRKGIK